MHYQGVNPIWTTQPTADFILVAVKAMLKNDTPAAAILAVITDLEAIGESERKQAELQHAEWQSTIAKEFVIKG